MFSLDMKPMKFFDWFLQNQDELSQQYLSQVGPIVSQTRRCHHCDGKGYHECDLGHEHECDPCDGEGTIEKEQDEVLQDFARNIYNTQVKSDYEKVNTFLKEQEHAG